MKFGSRENFEYEIKYLIKGSITFRIMISKQMPNKALIKLERVYCKYLGIFTKYAEK